MLSSNLLKSTIPIGRGGGFAEFDVEFRFAKIQNSHLCVCVWGGWNQFPTFDAESKFALKKICFAKNFLSFRAKIGSVLFCVFNTEWFAIRSIANHKEKFRSKSLLRQCQMQNISSFIRSFLCEKNHHLMFLKYPISSAQKCANHVNDKTLSFG